jgi:hypothetical protein
MAAFLHRSSFREGMLAVVPIRAIGARPLGESLLNATLRLEPPRR